MEQLKNISKFLNNKSNLEIEIKLGRYINTQFTADVNEVIFDKLLNILKNNNLQDNNTQINNKRSISCHKGHHRVELFLNNNNKIIEIEELNKKRIKNIDLHKDDMRITLSNEKVIVKETGLTNINKKIKNDYSNIDCFRYKDRQSIEYKNKLWRFDFTKVYDIDRPNTIYEFLEHISKNDLKYRLEVEIEYIGDYTDNLYESIKEIKDDIQDTLNIQSKLNNPEFKNIKNFP